jgi:HK97 family phage major capsid protein
MNRAVAQKVRQFDTAGGAQLWIQNLQYGLGSSSPTQGNVGYALLGYGAYESTAMASTVTTGAKVAILGDFNQFLIADRVGMSVEYVPHVFGTLATPSAIPRGERGIFAYWRVGSGVLATNAFRVMLA